MLRLSEINSPEDVKKCPYPDLQALSSEIRGAIIRTVATNGGHLASNLGAVELTIALHRVFDAPRDKIVFDVGHQCYAHKILTGRYGEFSSLRRIDGLCGFPRREESVYDAFDTGHASTAISAALGMARARDMAGGNYKVVAVVGDGALTGGMCYEALNDAGSRQTPMMVVLNDNGMSISKNVGALSKQLTRLRTSVGWLGIKKKTAAALERIPDGRKLYKVVRKAKNGLRNLLIREKFFTALGFQYFGPLDGHDIAGMERVFRRLQNAEGPVLVHVVTRKGHGFSQAEEKPEKYHGVAPFVMENGENRGTPQPSFGAAAGEILERLAETDGRICAVTAAMTASVGLGPFGKRFPGRLFDVGIAEEHAVTLAAGMAAAGMRPFVAIYETFLQRAYDQITEDVCLQGLPVCFLMDRAGLGGEDGATHHGVFGVSMLRNIPGMTVLAPRCKEELESMLQWALAHDGPTAIRYPRAVPEIQGPKGGFVPGQWEVLRPGKDAAVLASSAILEECVKAAVALQEQGISVQVVNASALRPLDEGFLRQAAEAGMPVITVEEHVLSGGFGGAVAEFFAKCRVAPPLLMLGLPDAFVPHGSRKALLQRYRLDWQGIALEVQKAVKK